MNLRVIILFVSILINLSCGDKEKSSNSAEDAFAKIDKKGETLFTEEDRKKSYKKSIALSNERNTSLKKNVTYNGYGASPKKMESVPKINSKSTEEKKNINYSYKRNRTSQTYSAYSTN
tara:strand:+ start:324 stop:680 length:357 start_codon:yes stop_codon:yes gene_type:complete